MTPKKHIFRLGKPQSKNTIRVGNNPRVQYSGEASGSSVGKKVKTATSWGAVTNWYKEHLEKDDTYHAQVITPNISRIVQGAKGMRILDIGCGEGYFTRLFATTGAYVEGADISPELVTTAKQQSPSITYHVAPADHLSFASREMFDVVTCVLALQNIERIETVFKECRRVLKPDGRVIFVINHPAYRIPKASSWGWDESLHIQYRRVNKYLSSSKEKIDMTPGKEEGKTYTYSFHRSLQDYSKALSSAGFAVQRLEEWISHKTSEKGPRARAEDVARKEFPLFLCIEAIVSERKNN